jgi:hypothetical protein
MKTMFYTKMMFNKKGNKSWISFSYMVTELFHVFYPRGDHWLYNIRVNCATVQNCTVLHFSVVIFFWYFGIIESSTFQWLEISTAQTGVRGIRDVDLFHYPSCTNSIKSSIQFLCNFVVYNVFKGSFFPDIWIDMLRLDMILVNCVEYLKF